MASAQPHYPNEFHVMEGATHMEVCKPTERGDKRYSVLEGLLKNAVGGDIDVSTADNERDSLGFRRGKRRPRS